MQGVQPSGVVVGMGPPPAQPPTFSFVVPAGAGYGTTLTVQAPNGQMLQVAVPPGTMPGASLTVAMPGAPVAAAPPPMAHAVVEEAPLEGTVVSDPPSYDESAPSGYSQPEAQPALGADHKGVIVGRVVS